MSPAAVPAPRLVEPRIEPASPRVTALRAAIARILERDRVRERTAPISPPVDEPPLPGEAVENELGFVRRIVTVHEPHHHHGRVAVARAQRVEPPDVARLANDPGIADVDLQRAVYVDTETTGLCGGTGTIPFLVGLGFFEDESFVVEQYLLTDLQSEPALMHAVRRRIESASCVVSFNGKAYDLPLLITRAVLVRAGAWPERPHIDLLHICRRSYRRRLPTLRLVELEREVLRYHREHDIDGAEVPSAYWSFLRNGRPSFVVPVLEHNLHDIVALAALLSTTAEGYARVDRRAEPEDQLCRALWALKCKDHPRVIAFAQAVVEGGAEVELTFEAAIAASTACRRDGDVDGEARWLSIAAAHADGPEARALVGLARTKHFEHRARTPAVALAEAKKLWELSPTPEVAHRLARLERKAASYHSPAAMMISATTTNGPKSKRTKRSQAAGRAKFRV